MKFDITHALAGVAVLVIVYMVGKKSATKDGKAGGGQPGNTIENPSEWWTFSGQWN